MLDGALKELPFEMLSRPEGIASARNLDSARMVLSALVAHWLQAELARRGGGLQVLESICRYLTVVFAERDCARLALVWQIAKGHRSAAILASNSTATTALTPSAQQVLEKVNEARRTLPPTSWERGNPPVMMLHSSCGSPATFVVISTMATGLGRDWRT